MRNSNIGSAFACYSRWVAVACSREKVSAFGRDFSFQSDQVDQTQAQVICLCVCVEVAPHNLPEVAPAARDKSDKWFGYENKSAV